MPERKVYFCTERLGSLSGTLGGGCSRASLPIDCSFYLDDVKFAYAAHKEAQCENKLTVYHKVEETRRSHKKLGRGY